MGESVAFYLLKRTALLAVVLLLGATFVFEMFFVLAGDPARILVPKGANEELYRQIVDDLKLNEPVFVQYGNFLVRFFTGDFPTSISYRPGADIGSLIYPSILATLGLYVSVSLIGCALGAFIEQTVSRWRSALTRTIGRGLALLLFAAPIAGLCMVFLWMIAVYDLPIPMRGGTVLPGLVGVIAAAAGYILIAGRPKSERPPGPRGIVVGAMNRVFSLLSMPDRKPALVVLSAWIMTAIMIIEIVFSRDGLGLQLFDAVLSFDYPLAMSVAFVLIVLMAVIQFVLDVSCTLVVRLTKRDRLLATEPQRQPDTDIIEGQRTGNVVLQADAEDGLLKAVLTALTSTWRGRIAVGALISMIIIGLAAPWLSTVSDPTSYANLEPISPTEGWTNPLPPSLDSSPYSGFIHPLGTDHFGRDIYSMVLYAFNDELVLAAIIVGIAILVGVANSILAFAVRAEPGFPSMFVRACASALSWTLLAIPVFGGLAVVTLVITRGADSFWNLSTLTLMVVLSWAPYALWALEKGKQRTADSDLPGLVADLRANMPGIFRLGKTVFLVTYMSIAALALIGLAATSGIYWSSIVESALLWSAAQQGAWWWILSPMLASILLAGVVYALLDTMEKSAEAYCDRRRNVQSFPKRANEPTEGFGVDK